MEATFDDLDKLLKIAMVLFAIGTGLALISLAMPLPLTIGVTTLLLFGATFIAVAAVGLTIINWNKLIED